MSPVADCNLNGFYTRASESPKNQAILQSFYGCLASAVNYLYNNKIRHRDIKPENILIKGSGVYLTDFGISLDWESLSRSTTTDDAGKTPIYCAPEVAHYQKRNSSSDIWSLGCVFLEMSTVLRGQKVDAMRTHFRRHSDSHKFYENLPAIKEWSNILLARGSEFDRHPLDWTALMLQEDPESRPSAYELYTNISNAKLGSGGETRKFCADCCVIDNDVESIGDSASDGELWAENFDEELIPSRLNTNSIVKAVASNSSVSQEASPFVRTSREDGDLWELSSTSPDVHQSRPSLAFPLIAEQSAPMIRAHLAHMTEGQPLSGQNISKISDAPESSSAKAFSLELSAIRKEIEVYISKQSNRQTIGTERQPFLASSLKTITEELGQEIKDEVSSARRSPSKNPQELESSSYATASLGPSHSRFYPKFDGTVDGMLSEMTETLGNATNETQNLQPWPIINFQGRLPKLSPIDWTTPSRLLYSVKNDQKFISFLFGYAPQVHALIRNALTSDLTRLIRLLIKNGLDVNSTAHVRDYGITPIRCVLEWENEEFEPLFSSMIKAGADVDAKIWKTNEVDRGSTLFEKAAMQGSIWAIKAMIATNHPSKPKGWETSLASAAACDQLETMRYLLGSLPIEPDYADYSIPTPLKMASFHGHDRVVHFILNSYRNQIDINNSGRDGCSPLFDACQGNHPRVVNLLLVYGADPDYDGYFSGEKCLQVAAKAGYIDIVRLLLEYGAILSERHPSGGNSTIKLAEKAGHAEIVKMLQKAEAQQYMQRK